MWIKELFTKLVLITNEVFFLSPSVDSKTWAAFALAAGLAICGGIFLIGIPGALLLVGMQKILNRMGISTPPSNEATWGVAILLSLAMPMSLPLTHFLTHLGVPKSLLSLVLITLVWWLVLSVAGALAKAK